MPTLLMLSALGIVCGLAVLLRVGDETMGFVLGLVLMAAGVVCVAVWCVEHFVLGIGAPTPPHLSPAQRSDTIAAAEGEAHSEGLNILGRPWIVGQFAVMAVDDPMIGRTCFSYGPGAISEWGSGFYSQSPCVGH